jgi:hypothetical protein
MAQPTCCDGRVVRRRLRPLILRERTMAKKAAKKKAAKKR